MSWFGVVFVLVYPYSDALSYPTNPQRNIVKCELRKYLREYKGIFHKLVDSDYEYYLQTLWLEHNKSDIERIMQNYEC